MSVEPFREPADIDPFGSCARYMMCPADMLVVTAASGELNHVAITETFVGSGQNRYVVRDRSAPLVAGAGCERVDEPTPPPPAAVVCTAGAIGFQQLGDGDDWITSPGGWVTGGAGDDVLTVSFGDADGGEGDDVLLVASGRADGEAGDDTVIGQRGEGGSGDDRDLLRGRARRDELDCGTGRRDRATVDRRDLVRRCEREGGDSQAPDTVAWPSRPAASPTWVVSAEAPQRGMADVTARAGPL